MNPGGLLWLLLLAAPRPGTVRGKVVRDFQECNWFFRDKVPPQGFGNDSASNLLRICQKYKNNYHFATLYQTDHRIPMYSAYRYPCSMGQDEAYRPAAWFVEPQIDNPNLPDEMANNIKSLGKLQALNSDYKGEDYERGHVYPFNLNNKTSGTSTCTLTNAVPMTPKANKIWYHKVEAVVTKLAGACHKSGRVMYLVTGPANITEEKLKERVSVPRFAWTALCCASPQDQSDDPCQNAPTSAEPEGEDEVTYNKDYSYAFMKDLESEAEVEHLTVNELQRRLGVGNIFNGCGSGSQDEGETFEEVKNLIKQIETSVANSKLEEDSLPQPLSKDDNGNDLVIEPIATPLELASEEVNEAICPSIISTVFIPFENIAHAAMTFVQLFAAVLRVIRVLAVAVLRIPFGIMYSTVSCLTTMAKYLIVTVLSVPQDLLCIVVSIVSDTTKIISWVGRLIRYLIRIL
ncbi:endonuclease domain-containing 1 protein-like [Hemitrygon akajei]|uniref:endonuclease domain-containing 1 protein-like n=1 Tax=Hemitrygon akajei TaxID=2704970 RepID=UPI003BF95BA8